MTKICKPAARNLRKRNDAVLREIELRQCKTNLSVAWMALVGSKVEAAVRLERDVVLGTGPGTNVVDGVEVGNAGGLRRCWDASLSMS